VAAFAPAVVEWAASIDSNLLMRAVRKHTDCAWVLLFIERWLKAPEQMEDGSLIARERGTPQGGVISPLLANLFLHYTFDLWMRRNHPDIPFERYADDVICHCRSEERLQEFALSLHSEKTRLIEFGHFAAENRKRRGLGQTGDLHLPGLHLYLQQNSSGQIPNQTEVPAGPHAGKVASHQTGIATEHASADSPAGKWLQQVVTGYFNYHAVPTNSSTLTAFLFHVTNLWRRTLRQRSQKDWTTWERIKRLADDWLPKPRILHPWPESRFAVRHPRWEPYARIGPVRICAGGAR
jgi:RNA-directed DNA polymerase